MADLARRAGVHVATVSRALRDDPRISTGRRAAVRQAAIELGYRPNPLVAALMAARRTRRSPAFQATLGWITKVPPERAEAFERDFGELHRGAAERAAQQGYQLQAFNLAADVSGRRTTEILLSRGIRGLVVAPLHSIQDALELDWARFGTIAVGYSWAGAPVSRVAHNHFTGLMLAARRCREAGRGRAGLVLPRRVHEKVEKRWLAADLLDQAERQEGERVPALILDDPDEHRFLTWLRRHRPATILCLEVERITAWLARAGRRVPEDVAVVSLDRRPADRGVAGINQDYAALGSNAVDLLVGVLQRNEVGVPPQPVTILAEGRWVGGRSLAPR